MKSGGRYRFPFERDRTSVGLENVRIHCGSKVNTVKANDGETIGTRTLREPEGNEIDAVGK